MYNNTALISTKFLEDDKKCFLNHGSDQYFNQHHKLYCIFIHVSLTNIFFYAKAYYEVYEPHNTSLFINTHLSYSQNIPN